MRKLFRSILLILGATMLLMISSALLGIPSPKFLLAVVTPIYQAANFISKKFGHELQCYGLHGGFSCEFVKSLPTDAEVKQHEDELMNQFSCETDEDCQLTSAGDCSLKSIAAGKPSKGACVCAKGPVVYGCLPKDRPL